MTKICVRRCLCLPLLWLCVGTADAAVFNQIGSHPLFDPANAVDTAVGVQILGNVAYCLTEKSGIIVLDVSDPAKPVKRGSVPIKMPVKDFAIVNDVAYVVGGTLINPPKPNPVLTIIDIADLNAPRVLSTTHGLNQVYDIEIRDNRAYLADPQNFVTVLDVMTPERTVELAKVQPNPATTIHDLCLANGLVYIAETDAMVVYDLSNPARPVRKGKFAAGPHVFETEIDGTHAYISAYNLINKTGKIHVLDLSNVATPKEVGFFGITNFVHDLAILDNYLLYLPSFLFNTDPPTTGLVAYNISNPAKPVLAARYSPGNTTRAHFGKLIANFETVDHRVYVVGSFGLQILELDSDGK